MRKNSIKNTRINEEVLRKLSEILRGSIKDPRIHPMTSIVSVEVAPDLKTCKAYVSVLGDEQSQKDTLAGLRSAEGYIRRSLAQSANLRHTPQITFIIDQSIEYGVNMSHLIDRVNRKADAEETLYQNEEDAEETLYQNEADAEETLYQNEADAEETLYQSEEDTRRQS